MQTRINNMKGKKRAKTLAMEKIEQIEAKVSKTHEGKSKLMKQMNVIEIND